MVSSTPSVVVCPPVASTLPSGSTVSVWYERRYFMRETSRQAGLAAVMSIAAARSVASRSGNSGSDHVPDLRILPGRYMTALWPSIGLLPTTDHSRVWRSSVRVTVSGPASNSLPFGSTNMNG